MPLQAHRLLAALGAHEAGPTDSDLLARFTTQRDAGAFELLVYRHAPLVLRVCHAVLRDRHAAEDAAQAVFLALARQARSVRGETLPGWLFRVSRRVALRAARRQPPPSADMDLDALPVPATRPAPDPAEVRLLHDELSRLPEAYRAPILLCYFEGRTRAEAAHRLGWPVGTVDGRLARAKERLAARLARRGVVPALLVAAVEPVPPCFAGAAARAAVAYSTGSTTGLPAAVVSLINRETRRTAMSRLAKGIGAALAVGVVAVGLGTAWGGDPSTPAQPEPARPPQPAAPVPAPPKAVVGKTSAVAPVTTDHHRRLLGALPAARAIVLVDGSAFFRDGTAIDPTALESDDLLAGLAGCVPEKGRSVAVLYFHYGAVPKHSAAGRRLLELTMEGVVGRAGFVPAVLSTDYDAEFAFADYVRPLRDAAGSSAAEAVVGDERAGAYPVRTPLSRVLTNSADGVVDVRDQLDFRAGDGIPAEVEKSVHAAVTALGLHRGQGVAFMVQSGAQDARSVDRLRRQVQDWCSAHGLTPR